MSVKIYFILLSCLAYYAMSVPTETNKPNEDVTIPVVDSVEDSTTIAEHVKQEENPPNTTLSEYQLGLLLDSFERADEGGRTIPLENILTFLEYSNGDQEGLQKFVDSMRQRGLMDKDEITVNDFIDSITEFSIKQGDLEKNNNFAVLSSDVIKALSDAVKKETDNGDGKIIFKKLESVMETMPENLDLTEFKKYLLENVFVNENHSISHKEFIEAMTEFKKLTIQKLNDKNLQMLFKNVDSDGDNKITAEEVLKFMTSNGGIWTLENCKNMLKLCDLDGNNYLNLAEFRLMVVTEEKSKYHNEEFNEIDSNKDGALSMNELQDGIDKKFGKVHEEQLKRIFVVLDVNYDGKVTKEEYVASRGM